MCPCLCVCKDTWKYLAYSFLYLIEDIIKKWYYLSVIKIYQTVQYNLHCLQDLLNMISYFVLCSSHVSVDIFSKTNQSTNLNRIFKNIYPKVVFHTFAILSKVSKPYLCRGKKNPFDSVI